MPVSNLGCVAVYCTHISFGDGCKRAFTHTVFLIMCLFYAHISGVNDLCNGNLSAFNSCINMQVS